MNAGMHSVPNDFLNDIAVNDIAVNAAELRELIDTVGGFTLDVCTGRRIRSGISVCTRPSSSLTFARSEWSDEGVDTWLAACTAALAPATRHIGGWLDQRSHHVWLDLVSVVAPAFRTEAYRLGVAMRQHGVFDLDRRELVDLRGEAS